MCIISAVVRVRPEHLGTLLPQLQSLPGVELAMNPGDGRLVLLLEDAERDQVLYTAAASLAAIAQWPQVLSTSLVYEYSGADDGSAAADRVRDFRDWRGSLGEAAKPRAGPPGT